MAAQTNNTDVFFLQLPQIAPAIAEFLKTYPSTLKASITSGDVTGSYGVRMTIVIAAEVLIEQCPSCAETQFDAPTFDCRWHRFEKRWMQIADAEGSTTEKAMRNLDRVVALWMAGRETRRAA